MDLGGQVESSGVFNTKPVSLESQALLLLACHIQKEHSIEHLLGCFIILMMVRFLRPKLLKYHKTDLESSTTELQLPLQIYTPLFSLAPFRGMYLLALVFFFSHGQINSMRITLFSLLEKMSSPSSVNAM